MRIYNSNNEIIDKQQADLSKGFLGTFITIKPEAEPLNENKKYWCDNDWEEALIYTLFEDMPNKNINQQPTQLDRIEAQVAYTAMLTDTLMEG